MMGKSKYTQTNLETNMCRVLCAQNLRFIALAVGVALFGFALYNTEPGTKMYANKEALPSSMHPYLGCGGFRCPMPQVSY